MRHIARNVVHRQSFKVRRSVLGLPPFEGGLVPSGWSGNGNWYPHHSFCLQPQVPPSWHSHKQRVIGHTNLLGRLVRFWMIFVGLLDLASKGSSGSKLELFFERVVTVRFQQFARRVPLECSDVKLLPPLNPFSFRFSFFRFLFFVFRLLFVSLFSF